MEIKYVPIEQVKENPNNPRTIKDKDFNKLVKSIKEFPQMMKLRPLVIDENGYVLGGNMRLKAHKKAGLTHVHIIEAKDLTEDQKREFIIKDNVSFGDWDFTDLQSNWDTIKLDDWGLDINFEDEVKNEKEEEIKIHSLFQLTIDFKTEDELKENYEKLLLLGYNCKIILI